MKYFLNGFCALLIIPLLACSSSQAKIKKEASVRSPTQNQTPKPKYGPEATLLSQSHQYIQLHEAPDYWAISPYYVSQQDDKSCSVATAAMIVNAARMGEKLTADDELATQQGLLKKVNDVEWNRAVGPDGKGLNLDHLRNEIEKSLKAYGIDRVTVEAFHVTDTTAASMAKVHDALVANEKSAHNFMVANFIQGVFTGDADIGHIAPVGAYDAKNKKVLIFDPDRQWYEPYWVSEETFVKGMATQDKDSGLFRGFLFIKIKK